MKIVRTTIQVGLPKSILLFHCSDTHIALADERDNARKLELAKNRFQYFPEAPRHFREALERAGKFDLLLHTGDLIDFISYANLDYVRKNMAGRSWFFAVGNHEFSRYVGEAFEDEQYKQKYFDAVQEVFPNPLGFSSRVFGGVNFVAVDNSYYLFAEFAVEALRRETARGYPIILMMHNPIHTDELYREMMVVRKRECAYLVGTPEEQLAGYPPERIRQQRPDAATLAFIEEVKHSPKIKAILAGHLHFNYETGLTPTLTQYIAGAGYWGDAREIEIV